MKNSLIAVTGFVAIVGSSSVLAAEEKMPMGGHHHDMSMMDTRTSLELSPQMKQHQLSNMRDHVDAIKSIVGLIAERKFEEASNIAHTKLGLTPEMQSMCNVFNNEKFRALGFSFHNSGDELGDALQTKDVDASLRALNKTMEYCVTCHATYRQ